jgi:hypothetical protein
MYVNLLCGANLTHIHYGEIVVMMLAVVTLGILVFTIYGIWLGVNKYV